MAHDISSNWGGLLLIVAAVIGQFFNAMRKGKPPTPPIPERPRPKAQSRPPILPKHPAPFFPDRPAPSAPLPQPVRDIFQRELSIPPAYVPPAPEPEPVERPVEILRDDTAVPPAPHHGTALDRLRLNTRDDWQRAILLSEVLQPPLALRG
jgi:hypothetical protein